MEAKGLDPKNRNEGTNSVGRWARIRPRYEVRPGEDGDRIDREHRYTEDPCRKIDFGQTSFGACQFRMRMWTARVVMRRLMALMTTGGAAGIAGAVAVTLGAPEERSHGNKHDCASPSRSHA